MKGIIAILLVFASCLALPDSAMAAEEKLAELLKEHKANMLELAKLRQKAVSEDEELKALHEQILELHAKMANKLDQKPEIRLLNDKIIGIEKQIEAERAEAEKKSLMKE